MKGQILQSNIVEKVLRDKEGRLVRARFSIYESAGRIKARLIDFVYIDTKELAGKVLAIFGIVKSALEASAKILFGSSTPKLVFAYQTIKTTGSKPRAPTSF